MISLLINRMCDYADQLHADGCERERKAVQQCLAMASTIFFRCTDSAKRFRNMPDTDVFEHLASMIPDVSCYKDKSTGVTFYNTGVSYRTVAYEFDSAFELVVSKLKGTGTFQMPKNRLNIEERRIIVDPIESVERTVSNLKSDENISGIVNESYMPIAKRLLVTDELVAKLAEHGYKIAIVKEETSTILGTDEQNTDYVKLEDVDTDYSGIEVSEDLDAEDVSRILSSVINS